MTEVQALNAKSFFILKKVTSRGISSSSGQNCFEIQTRRCQSVSVFRGEKESSLKEDITTKIWCPLILKISDTNIGDVTLLICSYDLRFSKFTPK